MEARELIKRDKFVQEFVLNNPQYSWMTSPKFGEGIANKDDVLEAVAKFMDVMNPTGRLNRSYKPYMHELPRLIMASGEGEEERIQRDIARAKVNRKEEIGFTMHSLRLQNDANVQEIYEKTKWEYCDSITYVQYVLDVNKRNTDKEQVLVDILKVIDSSDVSDYLKKIGSGCYSDVYHHPDNRFVVIVTRDSSKELLAMAERSPNSHIPHVVRLDVQTKDGRWVYVMQAMRTFKWVRNNYDDWSHSWDIPDMLQLYEQMTVLEGIQKGMGTYYGSHYISSSCENLVHEYGEETDVGDLISQQVHEAVNPDMAEKYPELLDDYIQLINSMNLTSAVRADMRCENVAVVGNKIILLDVMFPMDSTPRWD